MIYIEFGDKKYLIDSKKILYLSSYFDELTEEYCLDIVFGIDLEILLNFENKDDIDYYYKLIKIEMEKDKWKIYY